MAGETPARKIRAGVSFDLDVYQRLDLAVDDTTELAASRSEIVNTILRSFFFADGRAGESVPDLLRKERRTVRFRRRWLWDVINSTST